MILKLEQIPKRTLEVEKPDGEIITLTVRRFPLKNVPQLESEARALDLKRIEGKLDTCEYYNAVIGLLTEDFQPGCFDDLEVDHLMAISEGLQEIRKNKTAAEKKSRGR